MRVRNLPLRTMLIIISAFVLAACQPTASPTQSTQGNGIQDIRVQVAEPIRTTTKVEQFPLPNCGGTDKLAQSLGTYASASKSATVGAKATTTGSGEVAIPETVKLKLEIQVEFAYQQTFESVNSRLDTIEMSAAAGTHVVYTIVWEEQTFNSIVQYSSDGKVYEAPYTYKLSIPKIDTSYNVACSSGDNAGNDGSGNVVPPTAVVIATSPPSSSSSAVSLVSRISLGSDVPLAPLMKEILQSPSQVTQTQLENAVRHIQAEADRLHSGRFESNSVDIPQDNWWLVWCSNVPSKYYNGLPAGWDYLFEQQLPTFGQLYVVSPSAESRRLDSCNSPKGWWGVVIYLGNP